MKNTLINSLLISYMLSKNKYKKIQLIPKITKIKLNILIKNRKINFITYVTGIFCLLFGQVPILKNVSKKLQINFKFFKNFDNFYLPLFFLFISKKNKISFSHFEGNLIVLESRIKNLLNFYLPNNLYFQLIQILHSFTLRIYFSGTSKNITENFVVAVSMLNFNQISLLNVKS